MSHSMNTIIDEMNQEMQDEKDYEKEPIFIMQEKVHEYLLKEIKKLT